MANLLYQERARFIIDYFKPQFKSEKDLLEQCGLKYRATKNWKYLDDEERRQKLGDRKDSTVHSDKRNILRDFFKLKESIWTCEVHSVEELKKVFNSHREGIDFDEFIHIDEFQITKSEEELLNDFQNNKVELSKEDYKEHSFEFLFRVANLLLKNNDAKGALDIIEYIENSDSDFKYIYQREINHFKALCFSHSSIKDWDSAIHLLRQMYFDKSHIDNIETLTLLASNYKRKALSSKTNNNEWCKVEEIDEAMLLESMRLYHRIYTQRVTDKYYDGINLYYLAKIAEAIDIWHDKETDKKIYDEVVKDVKNFIPDQNNWWEVITKVEFLMLNGDSEAAISDIYMIFDNLDVKPFEIDATIRQIEMYTHFVDDESAKKVLDVLYQAKESISL